MALIIDANRAGDFRPPLRGHAPEMLRRPAAKQLRVTVGGQLLAELRKTSLLPMMVEWGRVGRLQRIEAASVEGELQSFAKIQCRSNDRHIVALARVSGARLIYTDDANLIADFKDLSLVSPKGKVIKSQTRKRVATSLLDRFGP